MLKVLHPHIRADKLVHGTTLKIRLNPSDELCIRVRPRMSLGWTMVVSNSDIEKLVLRKANVNHGSQHGKAMHLIAAAEVERLKPAATGQAEWNSGEPDKDSCVAALDQMP